MQPLALLGPVDALEPFIAYVILVLVLVNLGTRLLAHRRHVRQAERGEDDEALSRWLPHEAVNVLLVLASFYLVTVEYHAGVVMSMLVLGLVVTDFFEFEARKVEAREGREIERPKGALVASTLVFLYAAFTALFWLVEGYWQSIVS